MSRQSWETYNNERYCCEACIMVYCKLWGVEPAPLVCPKCGGPLVLIPDEDSHIHEVNP